jgi:hypothetical protein
MKTSNFSTAILVDQSPEEAFAAINQVSAWWTGSPGIEGSTGKLHDEFTYDYQPYHHSKQKVTEMVPGKKIAWLVIDSHINFVENKDEWTGTEIIFEISRKGDKTEVLFTHAGLTPAIECYDGCSNAWGSYIKGNLFDFISKGTVLPG